MTQPATRWSQRRRWWLGPAFVAPWLVGFTGLVAWPFGAGPAFVGTARGMPLFATEKAPTPPPWSVTSAVSVAVGVAEP